MGLELRNISKVVTGEMHPAEVDLKFEMGSSDVLLGRTMSGKTSLLRILAGLDRPSSGQVLVDDRDVTGVSVRKRSIAMVYQQFINDPFLSVYANISPTFKIAGTPKKRDRRTGTRSRRHAAPGDDARPDTRLAFRGQQQRIARALVKEAHLSVLRRPSSVP
jgi:glycerol transport system ATP-binding protein